MISVVTRSRVSPANVGGTPTGNARRLAASPLSPPPKMTSKFGKGAAASPSPAAAETASRPTEVSAVTASPRTPSPRVPLLRLTKTSPVAGGAVTSTPKAATPSNPSRAVVAAGKPSTSVAIAGSPSVERAGSTTPNGAVRKLRTGIYVSPKAPSLIFKPADAQPPPTTSAFHANQTHSNPFEGDRQTVFRNATKRTSITPHRERGSSPSTGGVPTGPSRSPAATGRRVPPALAHSTDPIAQTKDDAVTRSSARALGVARGAGTCAPPAKDAAGSAIQWQPPTVAPLRLGKRCSSAPASVREPSREPSVGLSTKSNQHKPTLTGVWTPEVRPQRATTPVRAPYAQATPRAATPPATRRPSVAPFATGDAKRATPALKKPEVTAPYHTMTPRASSPSASYKLRAPFHTTTPRGPATQNRPFTNNIF